MLQSKVFGQLLSSTSNELQTFSMTPILCAVLSVITNVIFSTMSASEYLYPVDAESILNVVSSRSFRVS